MEWWNVTKDEYYADRARESSSSINLFIEDRERYRAWKYDGAWMRAESKSMLIGSALHDVVLNDGERVVELPEINRRTKAGKAEYEQFAAEHMDKIILNPEQNQQVAGMALSINANKAARKLLYEADNAFETAYKWKDFETQTPMRCMFDAVCKDHVVDVKTTRDLKGFAHSAERYGYHRQAAIYIDAAEAALEVDKLDHFIIAVGSQPSYPCIVWQLEKGSILQGMAEYRDTLRAIKRCEAEQDWGHEMSGRVHTLRLPASSVSFLDNTLRDAVPAADPF